MDAPSHADDIPGGIRLQKILADAGIDSRRKCEEYVVTGRVTVDGEVVTDPGHKADPESQDVRLDGERLRPQKRRYYLLNKPPGYLCTNYDRAGRPRAVDLVPARDSRLFTVGRLDEQSQGLLLVTNDGALAQRLAHPKYQVPRSYRIQVAGVPTAETLAQLRKGVHFTEGRFGFRKTKRLKTHGKSAFLEVELTHGHNREIRRLFARFGHKVMWLQRVAFGPLKLGDLPAGRYRPLSTEEVKSLLAFARAGDEGEKPKRTKTTGHSKSPAQAKAPTRVKTPTQRKPRVGAGKSPPKSAERPRGRRILDVSGDAPKTSRTAGTAPRTGKPGRKPRE